MSEQPDPNAFKFEIKVVAEAEVRDADGHLVSTTPIEDTVIMTAAELDARGIERPKHPQE
jgi:hypothetical protein